MESRGFLLVSLTKEIDFRENDKSSHRNKDALKMQLLTHEIEQASIRPNFVSIISEVFNPSFV